jgi:hypothetical protein
VIHPVDPVDTAGDADSSCRPDRTGRLDPTSPRIVGDRR